MTVGLFYAGLLVLVVVAYLMGRGRSLQYGVELGGIRHLNSLPVYYGLLAAVWCGVPALLLSALWLLSSDAIITAWFVGGLPSAQQQLPVTDLEILVNTVKNVAAGNAGAGQPEEILAAGAVYRELTASSHAVVEIFLLLLAVAGLLLSLYRIAPGLRARVEVEKFAKAFLLSCALIAIFTTLGIIVSVLFESVRFFKLVPVHEFLFGLEWTPQIAIRADQAGSSGAFGAVPLFTGTLLISLIAMVLAVPAGLMSAIYLSEYASIRMRRTMKPLLELLAGIPTVVYGFFAALTVAPFVRDLGVDFGFAISSESAMVAGLVMGVMIIPFVSSLSDDVINAVPQAMRDGSYALGATKSETILKVIVPAALPGIVGGVLLAVSRAIGETMIVVMAAGLAANLTANPFESVTTVTAQIATLLVGDQEFDSAKTLAAFALGLVLFVVTLLFNVLALHIVKKYREQYE
jgi:phosphate transport system permease protein